VTGSLRCENCGKSFEIESGIPNMVLDDAKAEEEAQESGEDSMEITED
jgi:uncharacterized protein YbaR (Trm112 family)